MTRTVFEVPQDTVLPQSCTPCMTRLDARPWHSTVAVRTGDFVTGVRSNTADAATRLEELLAPIRVPHLDTEVAANFSVELGDETALRRQLHLVYRDHEVTARRRNSQELLLDLLEILDEASMLSVTEQPVVHATAMVTAAGDALLAPAQMHKALLTRQPQLAASGLELLRTRTHLVDIASARLRLGRQDPTLDDMISSWAEARTLTGSPPIRAWCVPGVGNEPFELRPAESVFAAFAMVLNRRTMGSGRALSELAAAAQVTHFLGLPMSTPAQVAETLVGLAT